MKNAYFVLFHRIMKKYVNDMGMAGETENDNKNNNGRKKFSQYELYNDLFKVQLKETPREDKGIDEGQLSKWTNGKENVPKGMLTYVFYNMEECRCYYSGVFEKYVDENNIFRTMETEKKLAEEMCQLKIDWGINLSSVTQDNNLWDILADLLVTALVCEYALHAVGLEIGLKQYLLAMLKFCKEKNVAFKTPFLLSALFQTDRSLLRYTLNKLEKGLGERWGNLLKQYVNAEHSQTFEVVNLDDITLLNYAKIRSCLNNKDEMDELEFCCAIVNYPDSSNTLQQLKNTLCKYGYNDYENWRKLLLQNEEELQGTTVDYCISD